MISRRVLFVFTLAGVSAIYLLLVRVLAVLLAAATDAFGPLVEVTLILGAAVTWLPVYEIITRFFSRQSAIYAEFGKRVIEEAARILDLGPRSQYLVEQVGKTFRLRRAALVLCGEPPRVAEYGPRTGTLPPEKLKDLAAWLDTRSHDVVHVKRLRLQDVGHQILSDSGFNYLFPLRYEDRLTGMLLADTTPRAFLDENETTLVGLSRQISLSIESCRLAESKIGLEKELLLQEHLATLGKVAATIAHEVKNPLSSIKTLAQLMREDPTVLERYDRDLDYMIAETDRLNGCVQQLLTFARPLPEPSGEVALSELLEGAADFLSRDSEKQGIHIDRRVAPGLKLAQANRQTVQQVVLNLLLNAVQASPCGSRVKLDAGREAGGKIRFRITDNGPGIPDEIRQKVFEPFFTSKHQGSGLGLAIVKKNVRQLGGEIDLTTPVAGGRGTCVSVAFPENGGA
jgi:signal transduction histidine kinase